ncbi:MAG: hypothetical protein CVV15_10660, partial [Gammaproteobacteria bacterium HGW-Gammaproteobacteria-5]
MNSKILSLALAASFFCAPVSAQGTATAPEDTAATLAVAQADLRDAARRVAELSHKQAGADPQQARKRRVMTLRSLDMSRPIIGIVMAENEEGNGVMIAAVTP